MINGVDFSSWETITNSQAVWNGQLLIDFAYIRARDGFRDDAKFAEFRAIMRTATTKNGTVLWGPYMFLGYSGTVGSRTWTAARGDVQAQECWNLTTAGGREFPLPVAIDCEKIPYIDPNGIRQIVPLPNAYAYCDAYLVPAIKFLTEKMGRRPVIYSNPDFILNYLAPVLSKPEFASICECPLWVAAWTKATGTVPYMDTIAAKTGWKTYLIQQYAGDVKDWPGINAIDLNRGQGTRAQWKAWILDATKVPVEGAPVPPPVDPPTPPPPAADLESRVATLEVRVGKHLAA
jgi:hypothetical protein